MAATLTEFEAAAVASIDKGRVAEELRRIVRIASVTGSEGPVQTEMARLMAAAGLGVRRLDPDPAEVSRDADFPGSEVARDSLPIVAGHLGGLRPGPRILLVGHVDVVPVGDRGQWRHDPFAGVVENGFLYGRGACDMKGGVAAALAAIRGLASVARRVELAGEAMFVSVPSEEDGGSGMLAAIRAGYTGDMAVITEPTRLRLVTTQAGAITFRLTVPGRAAHASMRRQGVSALEKLFLVHEALGVDETARNAAEQRPEMRALGLPYPTIIGIVEGGEWASTVPDRVVAQGRYGVRVGQTPAEAEAELRTAIARACHDDDWLREHPVEVEITGGRFASSAIPVEHPLVAGLAETAGEVLGSRPEKVGVPYGADMRLLINEGRTPTVIFGPGDPAVAHAANERVPLDEVVDCARVLAAWLVRQLLVRPG
ncbi:MAG: ArgE/DapE family deacylase [Candidatus Limnocylindrales bacterium]